MEATSVRVNVSMSKKCIDAVEKIISSTHLFNGKSDFVNSSIRNVIMKINKEKHKKCNELLKLNYNTVDIIHICRSELDSFLCELENEYTSTFDGPNIHQISIRLSVDTFDLIKKEFTNNCILEPSHFVRLSIVYNCRILSEYLKET